MKFDISSALIDEIAFAMENQDDCFRLDSKTCALVSGSEMEENALGSEYDERFYPIPDWTSADGYNLMLSFTASLHNENAKIALEKVLQRGKGVFRLFKETLESFPEVEKLWHEFRRREFEKKIRKWHESLAQSWGVVDSGVALDEALSENLESTESAEAASESIVCEDFVFERFVWQMNGEPLPDADEIEALKIEFNAELDLCLGNAAGKIVSGLFCKRDSAEGQNENLMLLAKSATGEIAGFIQAAFFLQQGEQTALISFLLVKKHFRGLGLAKELMRRLFMVFDEKKIQNAVLFCAIPEKFVPFLLRTNFVRYGSVFIAGMDRREK